MSAAPVDPLPLEPLAEFLDRQGLGHGPLEATRVGDGASNLTYLVERDGARVVVRRPPPPPLPPSAHDMVREARIQAGLAGTGVPVPRVLAICESDDVIGVPFYVMAVVDGINIGDELPAALDTPAERRRMGLGMADVLADLHAVDWRAAGLEGLGKPTGYLERQLRRWTGLWDVNATRDLPAFHRVGERLRATLPESPPATIVHGDYRLGNVMVSRAAPASIVAVVDWELATIGDPLADVGYLLATWSEPGATEHPMLLSPVTATGGFPTRDELARRYGAASGLEVSDLGWYQALALWKSAVFCEAIYGRYLRGERDDAWTASLGDGLPRIVDAAASCLKGGS
jgi:aminoglycoside phosphotransferase (APT) family kinase protein